MFVGEKIKGTKITETEYINPSSSEIGINESAEWNKQRDQNSQGKKKERKSLIIKKEKGDKWWFYFLQAINIDYL